MNPFTPFILLGITLVVSLGVWLVTRSFKQENRINLLQQSFEFFIQQSGKGAAVLLNTPNPAPDHIRPLLRKYVNDELTDPEERDILLNWAKELTNDKTKSRDERSLAYTLVGTLGAEKQLPVVGVGKNASNNH